MFPNKRNVEEEFDGSSHLMKHCSPISHALGIYLEIYIESNVTLIASNGKWKPKLNGRLLKNDSFAFCAYF
jgi:hypothetical protein